MAPSTDVALGDINLSDPEFLLRADRPAIFAELRIDLPSGGPTSASVPTSPAVTWP